MSRRSPSLFGDGSSGTLSVTPEQLISDQTYLTMYFPHPVRDAKGNSVATHQPILQDLIGYRIVNM